MSLSTRTVLSSLARPIVSPEIITELIAMLQALERETRNLLGNLQLNNRKSFEDFTDLGTIPVEKLPPGFSAAINKFQKFKLSLPAVVQSQLDNTFIQLPSLLGYTRIERFGNICFSKSPNRTPEQSCIFTSQIFLWQLIVNSGTEALRDFAIPNVVSDLAKILLYDIQLLAHVKFNNSVTNQKHCPSEAVLMPNVSYHDQLKQLQKQFGSTPNTKPCKLKISLFKHSKRTRRAATKKAAYSGPYGLSTLVEEDLAGEFENVLTCKA